MFLMKMIPVRDLCSFCRVLYNQRINHYLCTAYIDFHCAFYHGPPLCRAILATAVGNAQRWEFHSSALGVQEHDVQRLPAAAAKNLTREGIIQGRGEVAARLQRLPGKLDAPAHTRMETLDQPWVCKQTTQDTTWHHTRCQDCRSHEAL